MLATLVANKLRGGLKITPIQGSRLRRPAEGHAGGIAILTDGTAISEDLDIEAAERRG